MRIVENINGTWFYHWSDQPNGTHALCGAETMRTEIPESAWGFVGDLDERYCKKCEELKKLREQNNREPGSIGAQYGERSQSN